MIRVNNQSVVYVVCPVGVQTGGTELCHQLVDFLNDNGRNAFIVYVSRNHKIVEGDIPVGFLKYNINLATSIENIDQNIIVFPETLFHLSKTLNCNKMGYVFWWMSLDNYFYISNLRDYVRFSERKLKDILGKCINTITKKYPTMTFAELRNLEDRSLNVYQSSYANHFLLSQAIFNQLPLSDYVNLDFHEEVSSQNPKEDIILYNPIKGIEVTKKIMNKMPDHKFVALENLSRIQLQNLMKKAKLYIDFGNHPGKDRMPREAVINNCCVIVGKNGSAKYFEDVPIFENYKMNNDEIDLISEKIGFVLSNYETCIEDFNFIKKKILNERNVFEAEIKNIFFKY